MATVKGGEFVGPSPFEAQRSLFESLGGNLRALAAFREEKRQFNANRWLDLFKAGAESHPGGIVGFVKENEAFTKKGLGYIFGSGKLSETVFNDLSNSMMSAQQIDELSKAAFAGGDVQATRTYIEQRKAAQELEQAVSMTPPTATAKEPAVGHQPELAEYQVPTAMMQAQPSKSVTVEAPQGQPATGILVGGKVETAPNVPNLPPFELKRQGIEQVREVPFGQRRQETKTKEIYPERPTSTSLDDVVNQVIAGWKLKPEEMKPDIKERLKAFIQKNNQMAGDLSGKTVKVPKSVDELYKAGAMVPSAAVPIRPEAVRSALQSSGVPQERTEKVVGILNKPVAERSATEERLAEQGGAQVIYKVRDSLRSGPRMEMAQQAANYLNMLQRGGVLEMPPSGEVKDNPALAALFAAPAQIEQEKLAVARVEQQIRLAELDFRINTEIPFEKEKFEKNLALFEKTYNVNMAELGVRQQVAFVEMLKARLLLEGKAGMSEEQKIAFESLEKDYLKLREMAIKNAKGNSKYLATEWAKLLKDPKTKAVIEQYETQRDMLMFSGGMGGPEGMSLAGSLGEVAQKLLQKYGGQ